MCVRALARALSLERAAASVAACGSAGRHHPHRSAALDHTTNMPVFSRKEKKQGSCSWPFTATQKKHGMHAAAGETALPAGAGTQARGVGGTPCEFCCVARWPAGHSWGFPPAPAGWRCAPGSRAARRLGTAACVPCSRDRHDFRAHARLAPGLRWRAAKHLGQAGA